MDGIIILEIPVNHSGTIMMRVTMLLTISVAAISLTVALNLFLYSRMVVLSPSSQSA